MAICCHTIATAHNEGLLKDFVCSYALPVDRLVHSGIPGGTGKKANEPAFKRKRSNNPHRDLSNYGECVTVNDDDDTNDELDVPMRSYLYTTLLQQPVVAAKGV